MANIKPISGYNYDPYQIKAGDTFDQIAKANGTSVEGIQGANAGMIVPPPTGRYINIPQANKQLAGYYQTGDNERRTVSINGQTVRLGPNSSTSPTRAPSFIDRIKGLFQNQGQSQFLGTRGSVQPNQKIGGLAMPVAVNNQGVGANGSAGGVSPLPNRYSVGNYTPTNASAQPPNNTPRNPLAANQFSTPVPTNAQTDSGGRGGAYFNQLAQESNNLQSSIDVFKQNIALTGQPNFALLPKTITPQATEKIAQQYGITAYEWAKQSGYNLVNGQYVQTGAAPGAAGGANQPQAGQTIDNGKFEYVFNRKEGRLVLRNTQRGGAPAAAGPAATNVGSTPNDILSLRIEGG